MTTLELLRKVKEYIEYMEEVVDGEWGGCRYSKEIIKDGDMPELYQEVVNAIEWETIDKVETVEKLEDGTIKMIGSITPAGQSTEGDRIVWDGSPEAKEIKRKLKNNK